MKKIVSAISVLFIFYSLSAQEIAVPPVQKSLVTKHTATWCTICGGTSWDVYESMVQNLEEKAVVLSAHISGSSKLYSPAAVSLLNNFDVAVYQPEFYFNNTKISNSGNSGSAATLSTMTTKVDEAAAKIPMVQSGLRIFYEAATDSLRIQVKTKFFEQIESGEYSLSVLLVERFVTEQQASRGSAVTHKRILRKALTGDPNKAIGPMFASGAIAANAEFDWSTAIKWNNQYNLNNIEIVTIVWKRNPLTNKQELVNTNFSIEVEETTTATQQLDFLGNRFRLAPTLVTDDVFYVLLDLPMLYPDAELMLMDISGKRISNIHKGVLNTGNQRFTVIADRKLPSGIYFVTLRVGKNRVSRKLVIR